MIIRFDVTHMRSNFLIDHNISNKYKIIDCFLLVVCFSLITPAIINKCLDSTNKNPYKIVKSPQRNYIYYNLYNSMDMLWFSICYCRLFFMLLLICSWGTTCFSQDSLGYIFLNMSAHLFLVQISGEQRNCTHWNHLRVQTEQLPSWSCYLWWESEKTLNSFTCQKNAIVHKWTQDCIAGTSHLAWLNIRGQEVIPTMCPDG